MDGMEIVRAAGLGPAQVRELEEIYVEAFPANERIPIAELLDPLPGEDRSVFALIEDARVRAFASVTFLRGYAALFLEFLAVTREQRGAGRGSALWRHLRGTATEAGTVGIVLEIEDPHEPGISAEDQRIRQQRLRFYLRGGAKPLPIDDYRVPSRVGGPDLPFRILWAPTPGGEDWSAVQLCVLTQTLLWESYGVRPAPPSA